MTKPSDPLHKVAFVKIIWFFNFHIYLKILCRSKPNYLSKLIFIDIDLKNKDSEIMFMNEQIIRSSLNHGGFFISDSVSVMFNVSVFSVAARNVHRSDIVRVTQTWGKSSSNGVKIVRHPSPLGNLNTEGFFNDGWSNSVSHSDSFFFSIFAWGSSVPIPRIDVVIKFMHKINSGNDSDPHTEWTVTINGIFLEISIHFIGAYSMR